MGTRNPFTARLVMTSDQYEVWAEHLLVMQCSEAEALMTPWRTAAYFEEFDEDCNPYTANLLDGDKVEVMLNGHSKVATRFSLQEVYSKYSDEFVFMIYANDGEYPFVYSKNITEGYLRMAGLGSLRFSEEEFVYTNELESPDSILTGCIALSNTEWVSTSKLI